MTLSQVRTNSQAFAANLPAQDVTDLRRMYTDETRLMEALKAQVAYKAGIPGYEDQLA